LTILFAGGGTGGHIFPNVAVIETLRARSVGFEPILLTSQRQIDRDICDGLGIEAAVLPAQPLGRAPQAMLRAWFCYLGSKAKVRELIAQRRVAAIVGTGGFVSGPAIAAGAAAGVPTAMVNLDAVPGRANRAMARRASVVFTAYPSPHLPGAEHIGVPLRPSVLRSVEPGEARRQLGLDPDRPVLLITAGSQGARSINALMLACCTDPVARAALEGCQVLHQSGQHDGDPLRAAYDAAMIPSRVLPFIDDMGLAWSAATAAISRAGAGSAAEVWARAVPTIFLPYPYHKDQHQVHNARPLADAGGAVLGADHADPATNLDAIRTPLTELLTDADRRRRMHAALRQHAPPDGAAAVAEWVAARL